MSTNSHSVLHCQGEHDHADQTSCSLGKVIDRLADKWAIMAIAQLSDGSLRFNELMRRLPGVSHRMLTLTVRALERDGIVLRTASHKVPAKVDYTLTELGISLLGPLSHLARWADTREDDIVAARASYDQTETARKETEARQHRL